MGYEDAKELGGRVALVTGASRGIGRAIAVELGALGAKVIATGRQEFALVQTCDEIQSQGGEGVPLVGDLRDPGFTERLDRATSRIDLLVNNAAAFARYAPLERVEPEEIDAVFEVIVRAALRLTAHVLPGMKERGFGRIVNIGTIAVEHGAVGQVPYATAKSALIGFTKSVASETARFGITCNLVNPGLVATERIAESVALEYQRRILANTAAGRAGTPKEVAQLVAFLCSARASHITGAAIPVSGGFGLGLYVREAPGGDR